MGRPSRDDAHSLDFLPAALRRRTLVLDIVDSTNRLARDWVMDGAESGSLVLANEQSHGRGRHGRSWTSEAGESLLVSAIYAANGFRRQPGRAAILAACSVSRVIESLGNGLDVKIKWPNDILLNERKCAGILIESIASSVSTTLVVGIGINVNQRSFPDGLRFPATSLAAGTASEINRIELLESLIKELDGSFGGGIAVLATRDGATSERSDSNSDPTGRWENSLAFYRSHLFGLHKELSFSVSDNDRRIHGIFQGITDDGAMILDSAGKIVELWAGDVTGFGTSEA